MYIFRRCPSAVNVWVGPLLADVILKRLNWRWGYGIWLVVLPLSFLPLAVALAIARPRNVHHSKTGALVSFSKERTVWTSIRTLAIRLDIVGHLLLILGLAFTSGSLTLVSEGIVYSAKKVLVPFVAGAMILVLLPLWERNDTVAPTPFISRAFWTDRTLSGGLCLCFFHFGKSVAKSHKRSPDQ